MPLIKRCNTTSGSKNVAMLRREGRPRAQAVAIALRQLKQSCGCKTDRRMTPKQIVACGKRKRRRR
jgi:hypothetical protein